MNLLFCLHSFNINGVLNQNLSLAKHILKKLPDVRITVIAPTKKEGMLAYLALGIDAKAINPATDKDGFNTLANGSHDAILFESLFSLNYYGSLLAGNQKKSVLHIHEELPLTHKSDLWNVDAKSIDDYFSELVNSTVIFSGQKSQLHYSKKLLEYKIQSHVINNVVDVDKFKAIKRRDDGAFNIVQVGTIYERKGAIQTFEAFNILLKKYCIENANLVFVGARKGKPAEEDYVQQLVKRTKLLHLEDQVKIEPVITEPSKYYENASVVTLHSQSESYPTVFLEACYLGIPFVGSVVGCSQEMERKYGNALLFPIGDIEKHAQCLHQIYESQFPEKKMTREQLEVHFENNHDKMITRLLLKNGNS